MWKRPAEAEVGGGSGGCGGCCSRRLRRAGEWSGVVGGSAYVGPHGPLRFCREAGILPDRDWLPLNDRQSRARFLTVQLYRSLARCDLHNLHNLQNLHNAVDCLSCPTSFPASAASPSPRSTSVWSSACRACGGATPDRSRDCTS